MATPLLQRFSRNAIGKDYLVGDIHGAYRALAAHLEMISFNPETDRLFCAGDLVDRGPNCEEVLDWLAAPWFFSVRGNHEEMCMASFAGELTPISHMLDGGNWFLDLPRVVQSVYVDAFSDLPVAIELETANGLVGITHADVPVGDWRCLSDALSGQDGARMARICMWSRRRFRRRVEEQIGGVNAVVVGHHSVQQVKRLGNVFCIDTGGVYAYGHFTVLDAATLRPARIRGMSLCSS